MTFVLLLLKLSLLLQVVLVIENFYHEIAMAPNAASNDNFSPVGVSGVIFFFIEFCFVFRVYEKQVF